MNSKSRLIFIVSIFIILALFFTSCDGFAGEPVMKVWLDEPLNNSTYASGSLIDIICHARDTDGPGIKEVQIWINGELYNTVRADANEPLDMIPCQWEPDPGNYVVKVTAVSVGGGTVSTFATVHVLGQASSEEVPDLCSTVSSQDVSVMLLGWQSDGDYLVYFKFPQGVPGLKVAVPGQSGPWNYQAEFGFQYETVACNVESFDDRLFCQFERMSQFPGSPLPVTLRLGDCEVYSSMIIVPSQELIVVEPPESEDVDEPEAPVCNYSDTEEQCKCLYPDIYDWCPCAGGTVLWEPCPSDDPGCTSEWCWFH